MQATSEAATRWTGRSGRSYALDASERARDGGMASIRRVTAEGDANATSTVPQGTVLALKIARADDQLAVDALAREVETLATLSRAPGSPPCPRLFDVVGQPATALVMEWCPTDMERWWEETWKQPRAFLTLCEALADICRRVREYAAVAEIELGKRVIHADIKPRNVLLAADGRWLLTDFGAAKSRSVEDTQWAATRMILGTENYIAPEALFNARKAHPAAMDTWSIGCTFYALLRMRAFLKDGNRMPPNGTHAHHFRAHRVALVNDLQQRKPNLFADRELDPAQFSSPDKLPDKDRTAIGDAMAGVFGDPNATLEGVLAQECAHLLDRALRIDPSKRFRDPLEMAGEFEALAQRYRELELRAHGGTASRASGPTNPQPVPVGGVPPKPEVSGSGPRVLGGDDLVVVEGTGRKPTVVEAEPSRAKGWVAAVVMGLGAAALIALGLALGALAIAWEAQERAAVPAPSAPAPAPVVAPSPAGAPSPAAPAPPSVEAAAGSEPAPAPKPKATTKKPEGSKPSGVTPPEGSGLVLVSGGQAYLVGPKGKVPTGSVAAGTYELFVQPRPDGDFESQGTLVVASGDRIVWKCGLGTCRRL
ncbi:MAG: protein kinase domain-containing protein [Myxococcota bacterium]